MARNLFSIMGAKILPGFCFVLLFFDRSTVLVVCFGYFIYIIYFLFFLCYFGFFSLVENNFLEGDFKTKTKMWYALHICCILSTVVDSQQTCNKCCKLAICENRWEKWKKKTTPNSGNLHTVSEKGTWFVRTSSPSMCRS